MADPRSVLLVVNTARPQNLDAARSVTAQLADAGFEVRTLDDAATAAARTVGPGNAAENAELVLVLGGDGTFLAATELARPWGTPLLGVNLGHVGFLAEAEPRALDTAVQSIIARDYTVEERVCVEAEVLDGDQIVATAWALNEVSLERVNRERMLEVAVAVDGHPLLRFGCDGVLCSTPTGSTAYAFSAGGPIVWPNVDALLIVPNAAHALFARPIVVAPTSVVDIDLVSEAYEGVLSCDGRRSVELPAGARVRVRRATEAVRIVRLADGWTFAERLVSKFHLPVTGFRDGHGP